MEQLLKQFMEKIDHRFDKLEVDLQELRVDVTELKEGQQKLEAGQTKLQTDVTELKEGQLLLQQNIIDGLGAYIEKISEHTDNKTDALNKRVYRLEVEVERISRQ
ncbi:hypothetical protein H1D32_08725 [Anaerobacillus sp. CMMVII]|nr:hypothetical protein [Anaerobacillus sp. CMMVII]